MNEKEALEFAARIPSLAEKHRETARNIFKAELDYSAESISRLDAMIDEGWPDGPPGLLDQVVVGFGSYLGETIRRLHGGEWKFNAEDDFYFDVGNTGMKIWPFAKTRKRFLNGDGDSLGFYYSVIRREIEKGEATPASSSPPPVPSVPPVPPVRRKSRSAMPCAIMALVFLLAAGFAGYRLVQFVRYARTHPRHVQPGEAEFRAADAQIIAGTAGGAFGNSPEAVALAGEYAKNLKTLRDNFFTQGGKSLLGPLEGEFLTYCQLNDESCVFLVHVPELRDFAGDAKKSMADLAWMNAQSVLQAAGWTPPTNVVVGVKGLALYDSIMIGGYVAGPTPSTDGIITRGAGLNDLKLFYPFFVSNAVAAAQPAATAMTHSDVVILSAEFGMGKKVADVAGRVTELLQMQPAGFIANGHALGADPLPGKKKHLSIRYEYEGVTNAITIPGGKTVTWGTFTNNLPK